MHLNAEINWHAEFQKLIKGFDKLKLTNKQKKLLNYHLKIHEYFICINYCIYSLAWPNFLEIKRK